MQMMRIERGYHVSIVSSVLMMDLDLITTSETVYVNVVDFLPLITPRLKL